MFEVIYKLNNIMMKNIKFKDYLFQVSNCLQKEGYPERYRI